MDINVSSLHLDLGLDGYSISEGVASQLNVKDMYR